MGDWTPLFIILGLFAAVILWNLNADGMLIWDEAEYASLGRSIAEGNGYRISDDLHHIRPPAVPVAAAAVIALSGAGENGVVRIPTVLFALATIMIVYWAVWLECGAAPATLAAWSLAISPQFATNSIMVLSETPFMAWHAAALFSFYRAFRRGGGWFCLGWGCFALALSTRYTALLFGPTLALVVVYEWTRDRQNFKAILRSKSFWTAPLVAVAILGPWYLRQWMVFGDPLIGVKYASTQIPNYGVAEMPWHYYFVRMLPAMTLPVALLAVGGLAHGVIFARQRLAVYSAAAVLVVVGWHMQYGYKEFRLISSVLPLLAVGVGLATKSWADRQPRGRWPRLTVPVLVLTASSLLSIVVVRSVFENRKALGEPSFLDAMTFLRATTPEDATLIATNRAQVHWHTRRRTLPTPGSVEEFQERLDEVDWVIVTSFERGQPEYLNLLTEEVTLTDSVRGDAKVFRDSRFWTLAARSEWARARLEAD